MKRSLSAALLVAALAIGIGGQTAFAYGLNLDFKGDSSVSAEKEGGLFVKSDNSVEAKREGHLRAWGKSAAGLFFGRDGMKDGDPDHDNGFGNNENKQEDKDEHKDKDEDKNAKHGAFRGSVMGVAEVTDVSGATITAEQSFKLSAKSNGDSREVTIVTDEDTEIIARMGGEVSLASIDEGDLVSFSGKVTARDDGGYTVDASRVRVWGDVDLSAKVRATGTVESVSEADGQLVITTDNDETITVNASDRTVVKDEDGNTTLLADIAVGAEIMVKGWWNSLKDTILAVKVRVL